MLKLTLFSIAVGVIAGLTLYCLEHLLNKFKGKI